MKSHTAEQGDAVVAVPDLVAAAEQALPQQANALARARAFAEPLIASETLETGENTLAHAPWAARRPCRPRATWSTPART
jgi:GTP pyrophosphokinase